MDISNAKIKVLIRSLIGCIAKK